MSASRSCLRNSAVVFGVLGDMFTRTLLFTAFAAALAVAPAQAAIVDHSSGLITYNGHAGLVASAYQHNQTELEYTRSTAITDGTSNTVMFGARAAAPAGLGPGTDAPGP